MESKLYLLIKVQEKNSDKLKGIENDLKKDFIRLSLRNDKLLKSNDQLKEHLKQLNQIKEERQEKEIRKQIRSNHKPLPKRDPMIKN